MERPTLDEVPLKMFFVVVGILLMIIGMGISYVGGHTEYRYEVKAEQIEASPGYNPSSAVPLEELPPNNRDAIFEAYKKMDNFMESSSAYVVTDEPLNITEENRWEAVDIEGVHFLVAINGPEKLSAIDPLGVSGLFTVTIGVIIVFVSLMKRKKEKRNDTEWHHY